MPGPERWSRLTNLLNSKMNISSSTREVAVLDAKNAEFLFHLTVTYNQNVFLRQQNNKGNFRWNIRKNVLMVRCTSLWHIHFPQGNDRWKLNCLNHLKLDWRKHWKIRCEWRTAFHQQISDFCHSSKSHHRCHFGSDGLLRFGCQGFKTPDQSHLKVTGKAQGPCSVPVDSSRCSRGSRFGAEPSPCTWEPG